MKINSEEFQKYLDKLVKDRDIKHQELTEITNKIRMVERLLNALEDSRTQEAASIGYEVGFIVRKDRYDTST